MATEKKSWNDMSQEEQDERRKEERSMKRLENSSGIQRGLVIKKILEDKGISDPNAYRSEMARLNNLASNFDAQEERAYKKSYENKWAQSSAGIQANVDNQRIRQELSNFDWKASQGNSGIRLNYAEIQESNKRKLNLQDQLRFSNAQLRESKNSWISQTQAEDDRLTEYNEQKDQQEYVESKYGKGFQGDPGGNTTGKMQMQMPSRQPEGQSKGKQQVRGMPQEFMQSPAMAQRRKPSRPYDARTGHSLGDTQLNNFYRNEAALYRQVGGSPMGGGGSSQNPYLMSSSDRAVFNDNSKHQTAIDDAQKRNY